MKDMKNLDMVEKLTETLSSHPERITGKELNTCRKNLFNAGDDYVDLVMNYVGPQEEALTARRSKPCFRSP